VVVGARTERLLVGDRVNGKPIMIWIDGVVHEDCDLEAFTDHLEEVFFSDDPDLFPQLKVVSGIEVRPGDRWSQ